MRPTILLLLAFLASSSTGRAAGPLGLFERHADIGRPLRPGNASHDAAQATYSVTGGGDNMWFASDALHLLWREISGDFALTARIAFPESGGNAHRKAVLIVRQNTDTNAAYADAALHGDGLTSLQFRDEAGAPTREIQAAVKGPARLRIERRGHFFSMSVAGPGEALRPAGGAARVVLKDPVLVGLGVCAHDDNRAETAVFSEVTLVPLPPSASTNRVLHSTLETVNIASKDRRAVLHLAEHFEAPNWSRDGRSLLYNGRGRLHRFTLANGSVERLDTGFAVRCNNDHGYSPDGTRIVISDQTRDGRSRIYTLPAGGGEPRLVTELAPSYWHGWSPDGKTLAYCAERQGNYDIYTIPVDGGPELRLTTAAGLDDGPDYSPDGEWIYFNSERSGHMQIWRMRTDGTRQEQVTQDVSNDWFPHPSPDGKWLVYLAYRPEVQGHPANQEVELRLKPLSGGPTQVLARLFGGQGTINVPSWSPDSRQLAFVSYQLRPADEPTR